MNVSIIRIPSRLTLNPLVSLHVGFPTTLKDGEYMSNPAERQPGGNLCGSHVAKDVANTVRPVSYTHLTLPTTPYV